MIAPVDFYSLVTRAVKYGIQFLALAFMAVFCQELMSKRRVHPVQYLFTGVALVFFYVLLLSLAEHVGFGPAYLAASVATGVMLAAYVGAAPALKGLTMVAVFAGIYAILYFILHLKDYALLADAVLGFTALSIVMFVTLRVDWSGGTAPICPHAHPRHGLGAALVGDAIHVAGGGPIMGGSVQSAVHEAFTLG